MGSFAKLKVVGGAGSDVVPLVFPRREAGAAAAGRLLLVVADRRQAWAQAAAMDRARSRGATPAIDVVVHVGPSRAPFAARAYDLIVIDLSGAGAGFGSGLAAAARVLEGDPSVEIVFVCESERSPVAAAIRALGLRPVVFGFGGRDWLAAAAPALVRRARARRALRAAEAAVSSFPGGDATGAAPAVAARMPEPGGKPLPLMVAETRFRESYVRGLLATAGSRARAAQLAGIPYRTFCRIAQTLEIDAVGRSFRR